MLVVSVAIEAISHAVVLVVCIKYLLAPKDVCVGFVAIIFNRVVYLTRGCRGAATCSV